MKGCGVIGERLFSYEDALSILENAAAKIDIEEIMLTPSSAHGLVLSRSLESPEALPSFDNSAMDGFAIRSFDSGKAAVLEIVGELGCGDNPDDSLCLKAFQAVRIMTGAVLPKGADAVVAMENVTEDSGKIQLQASVLAGANVRYQGEDIACGTTILSAGSKLSPQAIMLASAVGIAHLPVFRRLRVVVISTGNELKSAEDGFLSRGQIRNSSQPFLEARLADLGAELLKSRTVCDESSTLFEALQDALALKPDLIITTGGVSVGRFDLIPGMLADLGGETLFHRVAIRPGKPILAARFQDRDETTMLFGLPGNPVATVVGLRFFVEPYMRALLRNDPLPCLSVPLGRSLSSPSHLRMFVKGFLSQDQDGKLVVEGLARQGSHMLRPFVEQNVWIEMKEGVASQEAGEMVKVFPMDGSSFSVARGVYGY